MRLLAKAGQSDGEASPVNDNRTSPLERRRKIIWGAFEEQTDVQKDQCQKRAALLIEADTLYRGGGYTKQSCMAIIARRAKVSTTTLFNWKRKCDGLDRCDWAAALASGQKGRPSKADCHPEAWRLFYG